MQDKHKVKSILYIAYHYPPIQGSSGVHRSLAFTRYLVENEWDTRVLTGSLKGYENWSSQQLKFIPERIKVIRAFCRNSVKLFGYKGKHFAWMVLPDPWQSWILSGFIRGLVSILKKRPDAIVSTYPIASAHLIAYLLHKVSGVPWIADFRDPMAQADYPSDANKKKIFLWIERKAVKHCKFVMLTAPGAIDFYQSKFPAVAKDFWQLIPNGFDQEILDQVRANNTAKSKSASAVKPIILLHSGIIYPSERDPQVLFSALAELKLEGVFNHHKLQVRMRASGYEANYQANIRALQIEDLVQFLPAIPYQQALNEMLNVDALLLLQAANCNYQIPAKAYEYIYAQKPILALTPLEGDTGKLLNVLGMSCIAPLDNKDKIKQAIKTFLHKLTTDDFTYLDPQGLHSYSRQYHAKTFERLLTQACEE
jgi:glycosyltransferase involved in cell wall biosynthesis